MPLDLGDLHVAGQGLVKWNQSGLAVRGDDGDGGCELVAVDVSGGAEKGDVGVVAPAGIHGSALDRGDDLLGEHP